MSANSLRARIFSMNIRGQTEEKCGCRKGVFLERGKGFALIGCLFSSVMMILELLFSQLPKNHCNYLYKLKAHYLAEAESNSTTPGENNGTFLAAKL